MKDTVTLLAQPSITDALAWSEDGVIAIAADDHLELLIPKLETRERTGNTDELWHPSITLTTNTFTFEEVFFEETAGYSSFSAGEEISSSHIVAIQWSFPGLAEHKRCVIGVLTSNLVLSLWAPVKGLSTNASNWQRILVVNNKLMDVFEAAHPDDIRQPYTLRSNAMKLFQRIRAFTFAHPFQSAQSHVHLLAVANDENQIIITQLKQPLSYFNPKLEDMIVLKQISLRESSVPLPSMDWTFEDYIVNGRYVGGLAWSEWTTSDGSKDKAILAYSTRKEIGFQLLTAAETSDGLTISAEPLQFRLSMPQTCMINGPMRFTSAKGQLYFTACFHDQIICCIFAKQYTAAPKIYKRQREEWSDISGLTVSKHDNGRIVAHTVIHNELKDDTMLDYSLPELEKMATSSLWQENVLSRQAIFAFDRHLAGKAETQLWGMGISSFGDHIAVLSTHKPSHSPSYVFNHAKRSDVQVQLRDEAVRGTFELPSKLRLQAFQDVNAEAIAFSVRYRIGVSTRPSNEHIATASILDDMVVRAYLEQKNDLPTMKDIRQVTNLTSFTEVMRATLTAVTTKTHRMETLINMLLGHNEKSSLIDRGNVGFFKILSKIIGQVRVHTQLDNLDQKLVSAWDCFESQCHDDGTFVYVLDDGANEAFEFCDLCQDPIPWVHPHQATCKSGHSFARCGLSLLSIQTPGTSKKCGICSSTFLNQRFLNEFHSGARIEEATTPPTAPLTRALFEVCDICIYCGGKFMA